MEREGSVRRLSLASQHEKLRFGALAQAIAAQDPILESCRKILLKKPGQRTLDDVHVLKSLLSSSKLLDFFLNLDSFKLDQLYQSLELVKFQGIGTFVFKQGDEGDSVYLVYSGQVEVLRYDEMDLNNTLEHRSMIHITYLNEGDCFGERALLSDNDLRAASIRLSKDNVELVMLNRLVFKDLLAASKEGNEEGAGISKHFRSNKDIIRNIFIRSPNRRSEKDLKFAVEYLQSVKFFSRFSFEVRKQLCRAMHFISTVSNTVVFSEGDFGRHFYIIFSGKVEVSVRTVNRFNSTSNSVVSTLSEGDSFGELALVDEEGVRRATVTCTSYCEFLVISRDEYGPLIQKYQNESHLQYAQLLRKNPYFTGPEWDDDTIEGMCSVMQEKMISYAGEICKQGSRAMELYIIVRGECVITHEGKHPMTGVISHYTLGHYGPNSVLGCAEASAGSFNDIYTRPYTIRAESPVKLLVLSRFDIFHLMPVEARESLQKSSQVDHQIESFASRALKTVVWEKYRREYVLKAIARSKHPTLTKAISAPTLGRDTLLKSIVDPGVLDLERHELIKFSRLPPSRKANRTGKALGSKPSSMPEELEISVPVNETIVDSSISNISPASKPPSRHSIVLGGLNRTRSVEKLPQLSLTEPRESSSKGSRRHSIERIKLERMESNIQKSLTDTGSHLNIWNPVHGVCQPFSVIGFLLEKSKTSTPATAVSKRSTLKSSDGRPTSQLSSSRSTRSLASVSSITHFRVFGKHRDLDTALNLFKHVCEVENTAIPDKDRSRFVIYKEDEMTMALENYFGPYGMENNQGKIPRQYKSSDLKQNTGQRFACVNVSVQCATPTVVEHVVVHVYQCFPTPQSAIRFAKQMVSSTLTTNPLSIIPLFTWVSLVEIHRFDPHNANLEEVLENAVHSARLTNAVASGSSWRARKDALRKSRIQQSFLLTKN